MTLSDSFYFLVVQSRSLKYSLFVRIRSVLASLGGRARLEYSKSLLLNDMAKTWQSSRMLFAFARVTGEVMLFDILLEIDYFSVYSHKTAAFVCAMIKNNLGHLYFSFL